MPPRFSLKYAGNKQTVKVRQGQVYQIKFGDGYTVDLQEQPRESRKGIGVHTHIWLFHDDMNRIMAIWDQFVRVDKSLPSRTHAFALVSQYRESEKEPGTFELEAVFELVIKRKLSRAPHRGAGAVGQQPG